LEGLVQSVEKRVYSINSVSAALAGCVGTRLKAVSLERGIVFDECTVRVEGAVDYDKASLVWVRMDIEFDTRESIKDAHVYGSKDWTELVEKAERLSPVATLVRKAYPHRAMPRLDDSGADAAPTTASKPTPGIEDDVIPPHEKDTGADEFRVYWTVRSV
jgi:OsmC-like protein